MVQELISKDGKTASLEGYRTDVPELVRLLQDKSIISWRIKYETNPNEVARKFKSITQEKSETLSYAEYCQRLKQKTDYDVLYDDVSKRIHFKDGRSVSIGHFENGTSIIRLLAQSRAPRCSSSIAEAIDIHGLNPEIAVRQAVKRIREKISPDLIETIPNRGYRLNPDINWLVLTEKV